MANEMIRRRRHLFVHVRFEFTGQVPNTKNPFRAAIANTFSLTLTAAGQTNTWNKFNVFFQTVDVIHAPGSPGPVTINFMQFASQDPWSEISLKGYPLRSRSL